LPTITEQTLIHHLSTFLSNIEAQIDNREPVDSQVLEDYIKAASLLKKDFGRKGDRITDADTILSFRILA